MRSECVQIAKLTCKTGTSQEHSEEGVFSHCSVDTRQGMVC